ncbi:MAG: putative nucleotide-diphospho-sugar transferase [Bradyrhizobium sp.]|nr:putative nucleotide-diphospho-sugar transferase [Bradyrhizobium sp.]
MTGAAHPTDFRPVVALFCTRGMEAFLANAIQGILQTGVEASQIHVGCPFNALRAVKGVTTRYSTDIRVIATQEISRNAAEVEGYASFGTPSFTEISWKKIHFIRQLIGHHSHVVYADLDVSWIRNPLPYLIEVALVFPIAVQTEGLPRFPPAICLGFVSLAKSERTIAFLDSMIDIHAGQLDSDRRLDDQAACQWLIEQDGTWLRDICCLPESLFLNGLGYRSLQKSNETPYPMEGELQPFVFHANWTIGIENKRKLLASTGTWLVGDTPVADQTAAPTSTERSPLLTVIYPVFDVRADVADRIRLWTEEQDFDNDQYRFVVVAGADMELDEASLQGILRDQDHILRVPGCGREADYWNAGAREATTPWLLFVEAHGLPSRSSLSALAAWIAANPGGEACNFRVENIDTHRVATLMKRWFAEIQAGWAASSTWRRLHRTAFAIRRDVFEDVGPFQPEYGQFAPPLYSARMDQFGFAISTLPTAVVMHDDAREISVHHADTADYVQGEMAARSANDPVFFEKYFGPSPSQGPDMILSAPHARSMLVSLVAAALYRPREAFRLFRQALAFGPAALIGLRNRARLLAARTGADELMVMHMPLAQATMWSRFLAAHGRLIRTEQMLWLARHPLPSLQARESKKRWPTSIIGQRAIVGLHALEYLDEAAFRWTHPVFLLRLAIARNGVLMLETRNLRRHIGLPDIIVVVGGRVLSSQHLTLDAAGNIGIDVKEQSASDVDVVVIVPEMSEPAVDGKPGRRLGLPLFSVGFESADSSMQGES